MNGKMTAEIWDTVDQPTDEYRPYRALSRTAVVCLVLGLFSASALATPALLVLPIVSIIAGLVSLGKIRRYPDELAGRAVALGGLVLSGICLVGGGGFHAYVYATEVPEGCVRISFNDLQPVPEAPHLPVPPKALELNGRRIFVKGYVYPDGQQYDIKRFVLVPDMGTCCFGGQPKLTDMIEVTLRDPLRVEFARRQRKLAGVLTVDTRLKPVSGLNGVYYQLDADYVR
jgi:hypothetical protein